MPQYNDTLATMQGHVRRFKQSAGSDLIRDWLNFRMRQVLDKRPFWAGTLTRTVLSVPDAYQTGQITLTNGSTQVTGNATSWPVNDLVSTTIAEGIKEPGDQFVVPVSTTNIDDNVVLYVDPAGTPEIVPVQQVKGSAFLGRFQFTHPANCVVVASSLAGRQLRMGQRNPMLTVRAITSATSMTLDQKWAGGNLTNSAYLLIQVYVTIGSDIKYLMYAVDPVLGLELQVNIPQAQLNAIDPWRESTDFPRYIGDYLPNESGNMQYELYPPPTHQRQFNVLYARQWPDMVRPGDRPPPFINPAILIHGALSDALRQKLNAQDGWVDLRTADHYEQRFSIGMDDAVNADNEKSQQAFQWNYAQMSGGPRGGDWALSHDADVFYGMV